MKDHKLASIKNAAAVILNQEYTSIMILNV